MKKPRLYHGFRVIHLVWVGIVYRLDRLIVPKLLAPSSWLFPLCFSSRIRTCVQQGRGAQLAAALEAMGPIFIKFAQILSMRQDILPHDIVTALSRLQDQVTPYDTDIAVQQIEDAFKSPLDKIFKKFDRSPLASASIAQVYAAQLHTGESVAVKVLRPGIRKAVMADIRLMYFIATLLSHCLPNGAQLRLPDIVSELEYSLHDELDLVCEASNASTFKRSFPDLHPLQVPKIYWAYTCKDILVMERVKGVRVTDLKALHAKGVDMKKLAELGLDLFFKQVFDKGFFHADMHGGNVFVNAADPENPGYICVDFGIMGSLNYEDKRYVAENLLAFFNRDYRKVAQLHVDSGWVAEDTRIDQFESAIRAVSEPIFSLPLEEISFGKLLVSLFKTARRFEFKIQPQLILLQKTLINVESLGGMLYPQLNLWDTAKPYLEQWIASQMGWEAGVDKVKQHMPAWLEQVPDWPILLNHLLHRAHKQSMVVAPMKVQAVKKPRRVYRGVMIFMLGILTGQLLYSSGLLLLRIGV